MIERDFTTVLTPLWASIDALKTRAKICERGQGVTTKFMALNADVSQLRKDVDHLKSTYFTSLFEQKEIPDVPSAHVPTCSEMPMTTTSDGIMEDQGL